MVQGMRRLVLCLVLALLALPVTAVPSPATTTVRAADQRDASLEQGILHEVNRIRVARGLRALVLSPALQAAASYQSRDMLDHGYFDHDQPGGASFGDRLKRFYPLVTGSNWAVGENLLWSTPGIGAGTAVKLWLNSPPHRKNLLDPTWREVGLGAYSTAVGTGAFSAANGPVVVVTMDFGSRGDTRFAAKR
jgi:uncharacterized protein YkwD